MHRRPRIVGVAVVLATALSGCGPRDSLNRQAVQGTVTLDGAALDHGVIEFAPQQPRGVGSGAVVENGRYAIAAEKGLPPGKYTVRIFAPDDGPDGADLGGPPGPGGIVPRKERVPPRYNVQSDQIVEVLDGGDNSFDFDIHTK